MIEQRYEAIGKLRPSQWESWREKNPDTAQQIENGLYDQDIAMNIMVMCNIILLLIILDCCKYGFRKKTCKKILPCTPFVGT